MQFGSVKLLTRPSCQLSENFGSRSISAKQCRAGTLWLWLVCLPYLKSPASMAFKIRGISDARISFPACTMLFCRSYDSTPLRTVVRSLRLECGTCGHRVRLYSVYGMFSHAGRHSPTIPPLRSRGQHRANREMNLVLVGGSCTPSLRVCVRFCLCLFFVGTLSCLARFRGPA